MGDERKADLLAPPRFREGRDGVMEEWREEWENFEDPSPKET